MNIIQEIWIIKESGIPIYDQRVEEKYDKHLIAGFLTAINNFVKELTYH